MPKIESVQARLEIAVTLASLLEHLERRASRVDADQFQLVVSKLKAALAEPFPEETLKPLLNQFPATAELYENMHYERAGLCQSSLERSVTTETLAAQWLAKAARSAKPSA